MGITTTTVTVRSSPTFPLIRAQNPIWGAGKAAPAEMGLNGFMHVVK